MHIVTTVSWQAWAGSTLVTAHVQRRLPMSQAAPSLRELSRLAERPPMQAAFLTDLCASMDPGTARRFEAFTDPRALAVVTGQQPGCVGGTSLVLLKAATAVALAARIARNLARPVIPVFWNASDDVDFDEISRVAWPGAAGEMLYLELPARDRKAQGFVGNLPAAGDDAAAEAALRLVQARGRQHLQEVLPREPRDHGHWVEMFLQRLFPTLAVVDGRNDALRRHAAGLYRRYLDMENDVPQMVETAGHALEGAGFPRTLGSESIRRGLFLLADGQRHKVEGDAAPLRQALAQAPETLGPNVLLRALVQDSLFPVVASVVGPAEIGYLHELQPLRQALQVPSSALVPRLSLTWLDPAGLETLQHLELSLQDFVRNPETALRRCIDERVQPSLKRLRPSFDALEAQLEAAAPEDAAAWRRRGVRRLQQLRDQLETEMAEAALQELLRSQPSLQRLRSLVRPRERPQERLVAALFFASRHGVALGEALRPVAETHLDALERQELFHWLVVD